MKVLLAHPGTQYSFQLARQLYRRNLLYEFHTGIAYGKDHWMYKLCSKLPSALFMKMSNRFIDGVPDRFIRRYGINEIKSLIRIRLGAEEEKTLFRRNEKFQKRIPAASIKKSDAVIGFDTSSLYLIERCKKAGVKFLLDVSIAHPLSKESVYKKILAAYPGWTFTVKQKDDDKIRIEEEEMRSADQIVVASRFTFKTYVEHGIDAGKMVVNPYGVDTANFKPVGKIYSAAKKINFVFVGLVDARKGVPFLLEAWRKAEIKDSTLTLIGPVSAVTRELINKTHPSVIVKGRIAHGQLIDELPGYDILVFPSFFEGFGLVVPEAMACGLAVITTDATCGPDIIDNGKEGFIITPGDEQGLIDAMEKLVNEKSRLGEMGVAARKKAMQLSWESYGENWERIIISSRN